MCCERKELIHFFTYSLIYFNYNFAPQHFLNFLPLPQGQGSFLPILERSMFSGSFGFSSFSSIMPRVLEKACERYNTVVDE